MYLFRKIKEDFNLVKFSDSDKRFLKKNKIILGCNSDKIVLLEINNNHPVLINNYLILQNKRFKNHKIIGLWTKIIVRKKGFKNLFNFFYEYIINYFLIKKWTKLYKSIGVSDFIILNNNFKNNFFSYKKKNFSNFTKKEILALKFKNILIGDLFYDFYQRFFQKPTIDLKDNYSLSKIYNYVGFMFLNLDKISLKFKNKIKFYMPQCSPYIQHGVPLRYFVNKNIETIGGQANCYVKKFTKKDYFEVSNVHNLKKYFKNVKNKKKVLKDVKNNIQQRFEGKKLNNYSDFYLIKTAYDKSKKKLNIKFDAIIFLPDFFDATHIFPPGKGVFEDFYEWINQTLFFLSKKNLRVAIKPHPNSVYASKMFENELIKKYSRHIFIDNQISNNRIFLNRPLFGISPYGTVLHELAYHNIIPISAGPNPFMSYDFVFTPSTKKQYFNFINLAIKKKLKLPKNKTQQICEQYYMWNNYNFDYFENKSRDYSLKTKLITSRTGDESKILDIYNKNLKSNFKKC